MDNLRQFIQIFASAAKGTPPGRSMHLRNLIFFLALVIGSSLWSQTPQLSSRSQISVLTCGPGEELYTAFGHSAFRVQDPNLGIDVVYNYGTFDFNAPNFYLNFARGRMIYTLSRQRFENFLYNYQLENRWVKEQLLDLDTNEKNDFFRFLEKNYKPENRDYQYDFLFNNCATKIPAVMDSVLAGKLDFGTSHLKDPRTFRELIREYLAVNSWAQFGIDVALGSVIDKKASVYEHMFIPDYVMEQMPNTTLDGKSIVMRERSIIENGYIGPGGFFATSPLFWFLLLFLFTLAITAIDFKNQTRSRWLDFSLFLVSGLTGVFLVFLWFFTDHHATANNFNLLWAMPLNLMACFYVFRSQHSIKWVGIYFKVLLVLLLLIPILWLADLQRFSPVLIPIWLALALRYAFLLWLRQQPEPSLGGR